MENITIDSDTSTVYEVSENELMDNIIKTEIRTDNLLYEVDYILQSVNADLCTYTSFNNDTILRKVEHDITCLASSPRQDFLNNEYKTIDVTGNIDTEIHTLQNNIIQDVEMCNIVNNDDEVNINEKNNETNEFTKNIQELNESVQNYVPNFTSTPLKKMNSNMLTDKYKNTIKTEFNSDGEEHIDAEIIQKNTGTQKLISVKQEIHQNSEIQTKTYSNLTVPMQNNFCKPYVNKTNVQNNDIDKNPINPKNIEYPSNSRQLLYNLLNDQNLCDVMNDNREMYNVGHNNKDSSVKIDKDVISLNRKGKIDFSWDLKTELTLQDANNPIQKIMLQRNKYANIFAKDERNLDKTINFQPYVNNETITSMQSIQATNYDTKNSKISKLLNNNENLLFESTLTENIKDDPDNTITPTNNERFLSKQNHNVSQISFPLDDPINSLKPGTDLYLEQKTETRPDLEYNKNQKINVTNVNKDNCDISVSNKDVIVDKPLYSETEKQYIIHLKRECKSYEHVKSQNNDDKNQKPSKNIENPHNDQNLSNIMNDSLEITKVNDVYHNKNSSEKIVKEIVLFNRNGERNFSWDLKTELTLQDSNNPIQKIMLHRNKYVNIFAKDEVDKTIKLQQQSVNNETITSKQYIETNINDTENSRISKSLNNKENLLFQSTLTENIMDDPDKTITPTNIKEINKTFLSNQNHIPLCSNDPVDSFKPNTDVYLEQKAEIVPAVEVQYNENQKINVTDINKDNIFNCDISVINKDVTIEKPLNSETEKQFIIDLKRECKKYDHVKSDSFININNSQTILTKPIISDINHLNNKVISDGNSTTVENSTLLPSSNSNTASSSNNRQGAPFNNVNTENKLMKTISPLKKKTDLLLSNSNILQQTNLKRCANEIIMNESKKIRLNIQCNNTSIKEDDSFAQDVTVENFTRLIFESQKTFDENDPNWRDLKDLNSAEEFFNYVLYQWQSDTLPNPHVNLTKKFILNTPKKKIRQNVLTEYNSLPLNRYYNKKIKMNQDKIRSLQATLNRQFKFRCSKSKERNIQSQISELVAEINKLEDNKEDLMGINKFYYEENGGWNAQYLNNKQYEDLTQQDKVMEFQREFYK